MVLSSHHVDCMLEAGSIATKLFSFSSIPKDEKLLDVSLTGLRRRVAWQPYHIVSMPSCNLSEDSLSQLSGARPVSFYEYILDKRFITRKTGRH